MARSKLKRHYQSFLYCLIIVNVDCILCVNTFFKFLINFSIKISVNDGLKIFLLKLMINKLSKL